ncbi:MAG: MarR family transcriptional regulator [Mycobacterium sp.]|nr:MarR family transcriptional regulator [Mycobacterium sp.]
MRCLSNRDCLSTAAAYLLNRVDREGPARLTTLACAEGTSQPSMTQLIQRLERQGLVTRLSDPDDGRAALVAITDAGRDLLDVRRTQRRNRLAEQLEALSEEDRNALQLAAVVALPVLRRLVDNAGLPAPRTTSEEYG